jgi:diguanylate cyclase (GGDEF)-like protein
VKLPNKDDIERLLAEMAQGSFEQRQEYADRIFPEGKQARVELVQERQNRRRLQREREIDPKTKLPNVTAFERALPSAEKDPLTDIVLFDGDNFGMINKAEGYGHLAGDMAIIEMAQAIRQAAIENGVGARVFRRGGGDEFAVLVPKPKARAVIKRAEQLFGSHAYPGFTVSLSGAHGGTFAEADARLQPAKKLRKRKHPRS